MGQLRHYLLGEVSWQRLVRSAVLIYVLVAAYVYVRADAMIFRPPPPTYDLLAQMRLIPMEGGDRLAVLYLPNPAATFTLLYSHGNAEDLVWLLTMILALLRAIATGRHCKTLPTFCTVCELTTSGVP